MMRRTLKLRLERGTGLARYTPLKAIRAARAAELTAGKPKREAAGQPPRTGEERST